MSDPQHDIEGLYRTHRAEVYRVALRKLGDHHEAEDVTQTAFLDAYRAMLRGSHPELPRAWLLAIAENVRRRRFRPAVRRLREEPLREDYAALDSAAREQAETIRTALGTLAETQRRAFLLRELGGLSYGDIATRLGTSVPAVQMLLFRARQKLRTELGSTGALGTLLGPQAFAGLASRFHAVAGAPQAAVVVAATVIAAGAEPRLTAPAPAGVPAQPEASPAPAAIRDQQPLPAVVRATVVRAQPVPVRAQPRRVSRPVPAQPLTPQEDGAEPVVRVAPPATPETDDEAPAPVLAPIQTSVNPEPIVSAAVPVQPPLPEAPVEAAPVPADVVIELPIPVPTDVVAEELIPDEVGSSLAQG